MEIRRTRGIRWSRLFGGGSNLCWLFSEMLKMTALAAL